MHRKNCVVCGVPVHSAPVSQLIPSHLSTVHWSQLVTLCDTLLLMPVRTLFLFPQPLPEAHVLPPDLTQAARSVTSVPPVLAWAVAVPPAVLGPGARPFWGARGAGAAACPEVGICLRFPSRPDWGCGSVRGSQTPLSSPHVQGPCRQRD